MGSATAGTSVVWLVLDEAPLYPLLRTDGTINSDRFPGFAQLASVSTWYRDTLTTAQRTTEAVPAILTGQWPSYKKYPFFGDHPQNLFTIAANKVELDVLQSVTSLCPEGLCPNRLSPDLQLPTYFAEAISRLASASSESKTETLHFSHVILPHRPWVMTPDLRAARELRSDPRSGSDLDRRRDSYQGLLRQYVATDRLLLDFLNRLMASQNWNRTLLIVTADHGITFVPGESVRDSINTARPETLDDIYRVPLFIKYPNQPAPEVSDCPVSSIDLLPTVLSVLKIEASPAIDGVSLTDTCPVSRVRRVFWPYSETSITTTFSTVMERVSYYDGWIRADGDVNDIYRVGLSGELIGTTITAPASKSVAGVTWTSMDPDSFTGIQDSRYGYVPARVSGKLTTTVNLCAKCEGLLVVDDVVVASIPEIAGAAPGPKALHFTTSVDTRTVTSRSGEGELWIADWSSGEPELSRVGPSR